jgi:hypothetical protein
VLIENMSLRRRVKDLEAGLRALALTPGQVDELGTLELTRLAHHYHRMLTATIDELRVRHLGIAEEMRAPQVRALEDELAMVQEGVGQARQEIHRLGEENQRLRTALTQAGATPDQAAG